jgi:hypothetical protein
VPENNFSFSSRAVDLPELLVLAKRAGGLFSSATDEFAATAAV